MSVCPKSGPHICCSTSLRDEALERLFTQAAYLHATKEGLYDRDCYMASNESEYWAEGSQSWFDATVRCGASLYSYDAVERIFTVYLGAALFLTEGQHVCTPFDGDACV